MNLEYQQVVEKRHERSQDKAKFDEKAEFMSINEHFELNFNAVLTSAIVFQQPDRDTLQEMESEKI